MMQVAVQLILQKGVVSNAESWLATLQAKWQLLYIMDLNHGSGSRTSKCLPYIDSPPRPVPVGSPPWIMKSCSKAAIVADCSCTSRRLSGSPQAMAHPYDAM